MQVLAFQTTIRMLLMCLPVLVYYLIGMYCFSSQEYAHDVGVAFINSRCVAVGELIKDF